MPPPEIRISIMELTALHRRVGFAEGLLRGWLTHDDGNRELCRTVTKEFLEGADNAEG